MVVAKYIGNSLFGASLRQCRKERNYSQQLVAAAAGISSRHLSFVECNKTGVSRKTLNRIFVVLELSLSQEDMLLNLAGFASAGASPNDMDIAGALPWPLQQILDLYSPYPAYLLDQHLNILSMNKVSELYLDYFEVDLRLFNGKPNLLLSIVHQDSLKPYLSNWGDVVRSLVWRLRLQAQQTAEAGVFASLEREVIAVVGVRDALRTEPNPLALHGCNNVFVGIGGASAEFTHVTSNFHADIDEGISIQYLIESFVPTNENSTAKFSDYLALPKSTKLRLSVRDTIMA